MNHEKLDILKSCLAKVGHYDYPFQSRVHPLRSFPDNCFVKRDDELGFGLTGSKVRKLRTLIPALKRRGIKKAIVLGGAHSNNVLGMLQLLIENGITPILFLLGNPDCEIRGTHLLIRMLADESMIHWIPRGCWPHVAEMANNLAMELNEKEHTTIVIPEGCAMPEAMPGAATLALDLLRNEMESKLIFDHVFLDAGTGFQAAATLLAYAFLEKTTVFTVVSMADSRTEFNQNLKISHGMFESWLGMEGPLPNNYEFIHPFSAKSFGSVNKMVLESLLNMSRMEGIFVDPIYTAKLFDTARHVLNNKSKNGNTLIVHSGGGLALTGFQSMLADKIKDIDEQ